MNKVLSVLVVMAVCLLFTVIMRKNDSSLEVENAITSTKVDPNEIKTRIDPNEVHQQVAIDYDIHFIKENDTKIIRAKIDEIERSMIDYQLIEKLNNNSASFREREQVLVQFKNLNRLRASELEVNLAAIEREIIKLESELPFRLQFFGAEQ